MVTRFVSSPPAGQHLETVRQFQELESYLGLLEDRIDPKPLANVFEEAMPPAGFEVSDDWVVLGDTGFGTLGQGAYLAVVSFIVEGISASASVQFRAVSDAAEKTGKPVRVGYARFGLSRAFIVSSGKGLRIEARGNACILDDYEVTLIEFPPHYQRGDSRNFDSGAGGRGDELGR
jgi:hypothetical protein